MKRHLRSLLASSLIVAALVSSCGGGGGSNDEGIPSVSDSAQTSYTSAMDALKAGDIKGAQNYFTQAIEAAPVSLGSSKSDLDLTAIITQSHFGRALTQIILLAESEPVAQLLAGFGQSPWTIDTVFGPSGFLARSWAIRTADEVNINISGSLNFSDSKPLAKSHPYSQSGFGYQSTGAYFRNSEMDALHDGELTTTVASNVTGNGGPGTGTCALKEGDTVTPQTLCSVPDSYGSMQDVYLLGMWAGEYGIDRIKSAGSVTINKIGTNLGDKFSLTFNDLTLWGRTIYNSGSSITINGSFTDTLTEGRVSFAGLPFSSVCRGKHCMVSRVTAGYRSTQAIDSLTDLEPLLDDIISDLTDAVGDTAASFDIPKELFYGISDMHVTHADMLTFLSSVYAAKAGINFLNSWTADIALDNLVDSSGTVIADKALIVSQLNEFFKLKDDHQLAQAQENLANAFTYGLQSVDEVIKGAAGGLLEMKGVNGPFYYELYDLLVDANAAMSAPAVIHALDPVVGVDFSYIFGASIDGSEIEYDPFVLEYGRIRAVEAYFIALMSNACGYDLHQRNSETIFSAAVRGIPMLAEAVFPNVIGNRIGGYNIYWRQ